MQQTQTYVPRASRQAPMRDPRFRGVDCASFDIEVTARRPMKPPPGLLPERTTTAGAIAASRELAHAGRSLGLREHDDDDAEQGDTLTLVNPR